MQKTKRQKKVHPNSCFFQQVFWERFLSWHKMPQHLFTNISTIWLEAVMMTYQNETIVSLKPGCVASYAQQMNEH